MYHLTEIIPANLHDIKNIADEAAVDSLYSAKLLPFIRCWSNVTKFKQFHIKAESDIRGTIVAELKGDDTGVYHDVASIVCTGGVTLAGFDMPIIEKPRPTFHLTEHRPGYIDNEYPVGKGSVHNWNELSTLLFVRRWFDNPEFVEFSLSWSDGSDTAHLMASLCNGKYWVVATVVVENGQFSDLGLPMWVKPIPAFKFTEATSGVVESMLQTFEFTTREELFAHPLVSTWSSKPDFIKFNIETSRDVEKREVFWLTTEATSVGHLVIGTIEITSTGGFPYPIRVLDIDYLEDDRSIAEPQPQVSPSSLNDIPGVSVTTRQHAEETSGKGSSQSVSELYESLRGQYNPLSAFVLTVLNHEDPGHDFHELREVAAQAYVETDDVEVGTEYTPNRYLVKSDAETLDRYGSFGVVVQAEQFRADNHEAFKAFCAMNEAEVQIHGRTALITRASETMLVRQDAYIVGGGGLFELCGTKEKFDEEFTDLNAAIAEINGTPAPLKNINLQLDPTDQDPLGTVAFILKSMGIITDPSTEEGEEVGEEATSEEKQQLLYAFQNTFMSPETSWTDLIEAAEAARRVGCETPGQLIEAQESEVLSDALRDEDRRSILNPAQQAEVDRIKAGLKSGAYASSGNTIGDVVRTQAMNPTKPTEG